MEECMIDLSKTRIIVTAWPDHRWPLEIIRWIEGLMVGVVHRDDYRSSVKVKNRECARNHAIRYDALGSDPSYEWFVFLDHDVRPLQGDKTTRFLRLEADVKCCEVKHGPDDTAYSWPTDFHEPFWCTSRKVLEAIEPPWFVQHYNEDHTQMVGCICKSFQQKVLAAGFTIAHGGWAKHDRDGSWCG